jgi:hypothetical protein
MVQFLRRRGNASRYIAVASVDAISQAPSRNLLLRFDICQINWVVPIIQAPSRNLMLCHEIQEIIGLCRLVRRPAEIIGLHGLMAFRAVPISQAPSGSREETRRCGQTAFFLGVRECVRAALAVIGVGKPQKGHGSLALGPDLAATRGARE